MSAMQCTRIVLNERPITCITDSTPTSFRTEHVPFDFQPGPGEVLVQAFVRPCYAGLAARRQELYPPSAIGSSPPLASRVRLS